MSSWNDLNATWDVLGLSPDATLTYLDLVNTTLRRLNEVPLKEGNFGTATGYHATVKEAVNASIRDINQAEFEWPFNNKIHTETLIPGTSIYTLPNGCKTVDWESFKLRRNDILGVSACKLPTISYQQYADRYQAQDENRDEGAVPGAVFRTNGFAFGVTPKPDKAYSVSFEYFGYTIELTDASDVTSIPDQYKHVIVDGAMYHGYLFRQNIEAAQIAYKKFQDGIKQMRLLMINREEYVRDTRVGGRSSMWF